MSASTKSRDSSLPEHNGAILGTISVLGEFSFRLGAEPSNDTIWRRSHPRRLIQLLGSAPNRSQSLRSLQTILWPDSEEAHARNRLHHTVHLVRKSFEKLPDKLRPRLLTQQEHLSLALPEGVVIDAQAFLEGMETDDRDQLLRFEALQVAVSWYHGPLAPDWPDLAEVLVRRQEFERRYVSALQELVELAQDIGKVDIALKYSTTLAQTSPEDVSLQCAHIELLASQGLGAEALSHGKRCRDVIAEIDPAGLGKLDETLRRVQRTLNQAATGSSLAVSGLVSENVQSASGESEALPSIQPLWGYEAILSSASSWLQEANCNQLLISGLPQTGKTQVAAALARIARKSTSPRVIWLDARAIASDDQLLHTIARAVDPGFEPRPEIDAARLSGLLHGRETLVVLDGLDRANAAVCRQLDECCHAVPETRWVVTSRRLLPLAAAKVIALDTDLLTRSGTPDTNQSPAERIFLNYAQSFGSHELGEDAQAIGRRIVAALEGHPMLLRLAALRLVFLAAHELLSAIHSSPAALLDLTGQEASGPAEVEASKQRSGLPQVPQLVESPGSIGMPAETARAAVLLKDWLGSAPQHVVRLLALATSSAGWLSLSDLRQLCQGESAGSIQDAVLDFAVRGHFLARRVRVAAEASWSEFRVPTLVRSALRLSGQHLQPEESYALLRAWLGKAPPGGEKHRLRNRVGVSHVEWLETRLVDFEVVVERLLRTGDLAGLASLFEPHLDVLHLSTRTQQLLAWLQHLGDCRAFLPAILASRLLLARARMHEAQGQFREAQHDAAAAMSLIDARDQSQIRQEARAILRRYRTSAADQFASDQSIDSVRAEAAASLLRSARLMRRWGQLSEALRCCDESLVLLNRPGQERALNDALIQRILILDAMGNLDEALESANRARSLARQCADPTQIVWADYMRARVFLGQMRIEVALRTASDAMAKATGQLSKSDIAHGLLLLACGHYVSEGLTVARALCTEVRQLVAGRGLTRLSNQSAMISALVDMRERRSAAAIPELFAAFEEQQGHPDLFDRQTDLLLVAELLNCIGQREACLVVLEELHLFESKADHSLRPLIEDRAAILRTSARAGLTLEANRPVHRQGRQDLPIPTDDAHRKLVPLVLNWIAVGN